MFLYFLFYHTTLPHLYPGEAVGEVRGVLAGQLLGGLAGAAVVPGAARHGGHGELLLRLEELLQHLPRLAELVAVVVGAGGVCGAGGGGHLCTCSGVVSTQWLCARSHVPGRDGNEAIYSVQHTALPPSSLSRSINKVMTRHTHFHSPQLLMIIFRGVFPPWNFGLWAYSPECADIVVCTRYSTQLNSSKWQWQNLDNFSQMPGKNGQIIKYLYVQA